ncbi:hypothetical protein NC651_010281 [Populus alba x Populus x berolinensis]|nr:hypothetical protein NC651_010281 [Populus alba x Populus x berolinensis]
MAGVTKFNLNHAGRFFFNSTFTCVENPWNFRVESAELSCCLLVCRGEGIHPVILGQFRWQRRASYPNPTVVNMYGHKLECSHNFFKYRERLAQSLACLGFVNRYSKKQCMTPFLEAQGSSGRKAVKRNGGKKQFKFQYDPSSYAPQF